MNTSYKIVGLGEVVWDVFPARKRLGGAPANFAYHCHQLGACAYPVSALGADALGRAARRQLEAKGIDLTYVQETAAWPTSQVLVSLSEHGKPVYEIIENVAWDHLELTEELAELAPSVDAVCFGVLSQRCEPARRAVQGFLDLMPSQTIKIFDINLRQSYYSKALVEECLERATVLKLSDEELPQLAESFELQGTVFEQLEGLRALFKLDLVAYTRGDEGSVLCCANAQDVHAGLPVTVVDSVGAGDSFTAALCVGLLQNWPLSEINAFANSVAAYVCGQKGATPTLPEKLIGPAIKSAACQL
ncbi:carbohydrate kinase [Coraliomargarita algicola]|uniref:Carbohydrate kinase n=1 Tax=Coraliomargarita algicola TaxID=3092156 RepID=A0ABZ0RMS4_9BACT|nr:carbohydrate kinase [Coraliomargarita sp. J2-16]WPJ97412.1 carbohydrate kinase [Coraliomargarita sp. J2-16]